MSFKYFLIAKLLCALGFQAVYAQYPLDNFEEPSIKQALALATYEADPSADAAYLFDINQAKYLSKDDGFYIQYTRKLRIKIFTVEGVDYGTVTLPYRRSFLNSPLRNIEGGTYYTDENGNRQYAPLNKANIADQHRFGQYYLKVLTFPQVKPGAVLELSYDYYTDLIQMLPDFDVQAYIPKAYVQYYTEIPGFYQYKLVRVGNVEYTTYERYVKSNVEKFGTAYTFQRMCINIVAEQVPAFVTEPYMPPEALARGQIEFQFTKMNLPNRVNLSELASWAGFNEWLLATKSWKGVVGKGRILRDQLPESALSGATLANAQRIYQWVQEHYTWNRELDFLPSQSTREFDGTKPGNIADINLALYNALDVAGFTVYPLVGSVKSSGILTSQGPVLSALNNVLVELIIDGQPYYLDASVRGLPFGILTMESYNGIMLRVDKKEPRLVNVSDGHIAKWEYEGIVKLNTESGQFESTWEMGREDIALGVPINKDWLIENWELEDVAWSKSAGLSSTLENAPTPFEGIYPVERTGDKLLVPLNIDKRMEINPFQADARVYPVQFTYPFQRDLRLTVHIPEGYQVEDMPQQRTVSLPGGLGLYYFSAKPGATKGTVDIQSSLRIRQEMLPLEMYPQVKALYEEMNAVQSGYLVLSPTSTPE